MTTAKPPAGGFLLPLMTLSLMAGVMLGRSADMWQLMTAAAALSLAIVLLTRHTVRHAAILLLTLCIGGLLSFHAWHPALPPEGESIVTGVIVQEVHLRQDGQVQTILTDVTVNGERLGADAYWTYYLDEDEPLPELLVPGARIAFIGKVYHPGGRTTPGDFDFREYLLQRGVHIGVYGAEELTAADGPFHLKGAAYIRHILTLRLMDVMGEEAGAVAAAMLLGTRDYLYDEDAEAFRRLSIAHILSISGYHVGVLAAMLSMLLKPLRLSRRTRFLLCGGVLASYCILTGGSAPVIRATLLFLLHETGRLRHHQNLPLHLLSLSAALQLIFSPPLLTSASFQLTYSAMLGLLILRPALKRLPGLRRENVLTEGLCASIAAQLGILPVQLYWFGEIPLLGFALNIAVMSLTSGVMALYWLTLALLGVPGLNTLIGRCAAATTNILLSIARWMSENIAVSLPVRQPDWLHVTGWLLLLTGASILIPRHRAKLRRTLVIAGMALMLTILIPLPHLQTEYIQFSVGDADAALLHDRNTVVVIDAGGEGLELAGYLSDRCLTVDALILTHLHEDHAGGARELLSQGVPIRACYFPVGAQQAGDLDETLQPLLQELNDAGVPIMYLSRGNRLDLPSGSLTALWPQENLLQPGHPANDASLTLLAKLHGTTLLLTGDLTGTYEHYAAQPADILKAAHHGSTSSTSPEFLQAVSPQLVLLSCGSEEREASFAERCPLPILSTHSCGTITLRFTPGGFTAQTYLPREQ